MLLFRGTGTTFHVAEAADTSVSLRGVVSAGAGYAKYPEDNFIYDMNDNLLWSTDLRLLGEFTPGQFFKASVNILQNISSTQVASIPGTRGRQQEVERSSFFFLDEHETDNTRASLTLDQGSFSLGNVSNELTIGRQPVNMSVTFYFTPNDFFAPFAPQTFYREFKPGVDAVRYERRLADLTQLTLITVLGYFPDRSSDNGWSRAPDWQRTSILGRLTHIIGRYELGLLGGMLSDYSVAGASLQGDLFDWLGIRGECNYKDTWKDNLTDGLQISIGLEHRFSNSLIARIEQMHNGLGYASIDDVDEAFSDNSLRQGFLGRDYSAVALSYEFTPLFTGDFLFLNNWTDSSQSYSLYGLYSLTDESELALSFNFSPSEAPDLRSIHSEFGILPATVILEYRLYF